MKIRSLVILLIILFSLPGKSDAQKVKITGILKDSISQEPLPYSNVIILNSRDSLLEGGMTDGNGKFRLRLKARENLTLEARSLGYRSKRLPLELQGKSKLALESIYLPRDTAVLNEVDISAQNAVIQKFDRKIYRMNENKKAAARDIYDLLRTLPGVVVDQDNNIRYKGTTPEIMVDDMPAQYVYPDIAMIPIDNVEKIELIDASMRSGGSGKGGIINIKLKHATSDGLSGVGSIRGYSEKFDKLLNSRGYLNLNYKHNKVIFFNNLWYYGRNSSNKSTTTGELTFDEEVYSLNNQSFSESGFHYLSNYLGARIIFSDKTKLIVAGGIREKGSSGESTYQSEMKQDSDIYQQYEKDSESGSEGLSASAYTYFRHSFDTTLREFTAYLHYSIPDFNDKRTGKNIYHYSYRDAQSVDETTIYSYENKDKTGSLHSGLYYNHPLNEKTRWNARYRASYRNIIKDKYRHWIDEQINLPQCRNTEGYTHSHSLSLRFGTKLKKWKLDAGLKQEYEQYDIAFKHHTEQLQDTTIKLSENFYNLSPSTTINYNVDSLQDMKLSFSRTVRNPYYSSMNPFILKTSPASWSSGNPDLSPATYYNIYLGYTLNKSMWNFSSELFYSITDNERSRVSYPVTETIYMTLPENIAFQSQLGLDLSSYFSLAGRYNFSLSSKLYHTYMDATSMDDKASQSGIPSEDVIKRNYGFHVKLNTTVKITKQASGMIHLNYQSREIEFDGYEYGYLNSYLSLTHRFFKRKLRVSLGVSNLLDDLLNRGSYRNYLGIEQKKTVKDATRISRMYFLSLKYRFRQGDRNTGKVGRGQ